MRPHQSAGPAEISVFCAADKVGRCNAGTAERQTGMSAIGPGNPPNDPPRKDTPQRRLPDYRARPVGSDAAAACRRAAGKGASYRGILRCVVSLGLWLAYAGFAYATPPASAPHAALNHAIELSDLQLDSLTAAAAVRLNLSAFAQGPTAATVTQGSVRSARTSILPIAADPRAPAAARWHSTGAPVPAAVFLASGRASATGQSGAQCTATVEMIGDFAYSKDISERASVPATAAAPPSVTCLCSAITISLLPH